MVASSFARAEPWRNASLVSRRYAAVAIPTRRRQPGARMTDAPPRILVLAPDPWEAGGIGRATRTLLRALTDLYGEGAVAVLPLWGRTDGVWLPGRVLRRGALQGDRCRVPLNVRLRYLADALRAGFRSPASLVVIVAHAHLAPVAHAVTRVGGHRCVVWAHGYEVWGRTSRLVATSVRRADAIWAVSRFTAGRLRADGLDPAGRTKLLSHALPPELELPPASGDDDPVVLTVGALEPAMRYKGIDTLLYAWPTVSHRVPDARLVVVGDGEDRLRLERIAEALSITGTVDFTGRVSDARLAETYATASVFALPARACTGPDARGEGFGLVLVEAAAAGLPVVAGRAGGATEAVRDGETGVLVDPREPGQVADAITELLRDRARARAMGAAGRRWVTQRFSFERFRDDVARLVEDVRRAPDQPASVRS